MGKKDKKKVDNKKQAETQNTKLTFFDYITIIASIILLICFSVLLYILHNIISSVDFNDQLSLTKRSVHQLLDEINQADRDNSNSENAKYISESLENATIAGSIYQIFENQSFYDKALFAIQARSSICREKVHRQAVNQFSKLLTKFIAFSGYKFQCNTEFIKEYLPLCYSQHKKFNSVFSLINEMAKTSCSKEVVRALNKTSRQSQNFYLNFRIIKLLDQSPILKIKEMDRIEADDLICSLTENAIESLPQTLHKEVRKDFCNFVENHKCDVLADQGIADLCKKVEKDENL